jgi:hypothetical protein
MEENIPKDLTLEFYHSRDYKSQKYVAVNTLDLGKSESPALPSLPVIEGLAFPAALLYDSRERTISPGLQLKPLLFHTPSRLP